MKNKINYVFSFKVLAIMAIYLFIAVAHIFYLSNNTAAKISHSTSLFKRKVENVQCVNAVKRTDKATIEENSVQSVVKIAVLDLSFPFISRGEPANKTKQPVPESTLTFGGDRYAYLSLCTFRI
ncbi:hypothetical protein KXD93_11675 [Mucilaginibacter sp. BJC16-A38]|uniref:hypothetical protein n=1 Tax=Mucilaginibacter phenanthrenivorans TaxID=1234842 RepID=UPI002158164E|nr:hypothetical protein [Mucilaginibacter phenanthrenivorans]MCR8558310.1 hypothetical protein [Mucilaginibacter phenanthrenivorans]